MGVVGDGDEFSTIREESINKVRGNGDSMGEEKQEREK